MKTKAVATRRMFFSKAGAALSAPLVVAGAHAAQRDAGDAEALRARLAMLEDVNAIRELQRAYARRVNAGAHAAVAELFADPAQAHIDVRIRSMATDGFAEHDVIDVAEDGWSATSRVQCTVELATPIGPGCTLVDMAREQGEGVLKRSETRVLESSYVKRGGVWRVERSVLRSAR